jgi:hypothetical protein
MIGRLLPLLAVAATGCVGGVASAQDRAGLFLDPQLLPADTRPDECVTRRVTGPGGAYRWDRIECGAPIGGGVGSWRSGYEPLRVEDAAWRGDRYGGWRAAYGSRSSDGRDHDRQDAGRRYADAYPIYHVAGRDADGYLVWPGKLP